MTKPTHGPEFELFLRSFCLINCDPAGMLDEEFERVVAEHCRRAGYDIDEVFAAIHAHPELLAFASRDGESIIISTAPAEGDNVVYLNRVAR